jgi:hypothetical protein
MQVLVVFIDIKLIEKIIIIIFSAFFCTVDYFELNKTAYFSGISFHFFVVGTSIVVNQSRV